MLASLQEVIALSTKEGQIVTAADNADWMAEPDGSVTVAIGTMEDGGVWITLRPDGTYDLQPIAP